MRIGYKDIEIGFYPFSAYILSSHAILIFKPHSTCLYKLANFDEANNSLKVIKVLEFKLDHLNINYELKHEIAIKGFFYFNL